MQIKKALVIRGIVIFSPNSKLILQAKGVRLSPDQGKLFGEKPGGSLMQFHKSGKISVNQNVGGLVVASV